MIAVTRMKAACFQNGKNGVTDPLGTGTGPKDEIMLFLAMYYMYIL